MKNKLKSKELMYCIAIFLLEIFLFRAFLQQEDLMFGNNGDGRFCMLATEHWYKVIRGGEGILDLNMFYPELKTLAYSDLFLGLAIPHVIFRFLGFNVYSAFRFTLIFIHGFGAYLTYWTLHKKLKLNNFASLVGTIIFVYSSIPNIYGHPQLFAKFFYPLLAWCIISFFEETALTQRNPMKRCIYAMCTISVLALIFYTSGYLGYFAVIYMALFAIVYFIMKLYIQKNIIFEICNFVKENIWECVWYIIWGVLLFLPFMIIYIPISREFGDRSWSEVLDFLPTIGNVFSIDSRNIFYGSIFQGLNFSASNTELATGIPIIVFILCMFLFFQLKKNIGEKKNFIAVAVLFSIALNLLLILKIGANISAWYLIWKFIPGVSSIRAVSRLNHLITFGIAIFIAIGIDVCLKKKQYALNIMLFALVCLQYIWGGRAALNWSETDSVAMLEKIKDPPENCEAMFAILPKNDYTAAYSPMQLYGWEIADYLGIKNINGFSSNYPNDWLPIYDMTSPVYEIRVYNWCKKMGIDMKHVFGYDIVNNEWISMESMPAVNLISNKTPNQSAVWKNETMYLLPEGYIYGPYVELLSGEYTLSLQGNGLENVLLKIMKGGEEASISMEMIECSSEMLCVDFYVPEDMGDLEFVVTNVNSENVVSINEMILCKSNVSS